MQQPNYGQPMGGCPQTLRRQASFSGIVEFWDFYGFLVLLGCSCSRNKDLIHHVDEETKIQSKRWGSGPRKPDRLLIPTGITVDTKQKKPSLAADPSLPRFFFENICRYGAPQQGGYGPMGGAPGPDPRYAPYGQPQPSYGGRVFRHQVWPVHDGRR